MNYWLVMAGAAAMMSCTSVQETALDNGFIRLSLKGASVTSLQVDPGGRGGGSISFIKDLRPEFWHEMPDTRIEVSGNRAVVSPLEIRENQPVSVGNTRTPVKLEKGHTLGQTFKVPQGAKLVSVSIRTPTWNTETSGATLSLYKGNELIVSRRLENVPDNSWQQLEPKTPLEEGVYRIEMSEPVGDIGWWSSESDVSPVGQADADGKTLDADRALQLSLVSNIGTGTLTFTLDKDRLRVDAEYKPVAKAKHPAFPWRWKTTWTKSGYDCSSKAGVVFSRFYTDNQRYMPIQQLKRRDHGGLSFKGCRWIEMDGTKDADLRLEADDLSMHWEMPLEDEMSLRFDTPLENSGDMIKTSWTLTINKRDDSVPDEFPRFACSDKKLEADLNRFWWERAFSYGSPASRSIEFSEWMAMMRAWYEGPQREGEIKRLINYPITEEGYVHTYGDIIGWPLVPNRDTRHFDTNARFILACWRHYLWTGDNDFLQSQIARLRKAMSYQLEVLKGKDGLIVTPEFKTGRHEDLSNNYWDILPFGHKDAYANAVFYGSLEAMAQLETAVLGLTTEGTEVLGGKDDAGKGEVISEKQPGTNPLSPQSSVLSPAYYRALAKKVRSAYNSTFWLDDKGRYAGCEDIDGKVYDYGFTFVNLEALFYGLGDKEKARRIYKWMETEPTSTGKPDTYSKWIFAPRANTIHNPMWGKKASADELKNPTPPWWTYWWAGTPYGDQCQDGGAILYTSFFDLMDRVRYLGAENAWKRFTEIMERYRMPDRLCGGSPLYRGETSQQENAGSVGVDYPFPESGLVPCFFLYGVMGIHATSEGLQIKPDLPESLTFAEVKHIHWRGAKLRVRVTRESVEVDGTARDGKAVHKKYAIKRGDGVVLRLP